MTTITVSAHQLGSKKAILTDLHVDISPATALTLRGVLTSVVEEQVRAYENRQAANSLLRILSPEEINQGRAAGKVDLGDHAVQPIDPQQAIDTALLGFTDGLYFVFIDDQQIEQLDQVVTLNPDSRLKFIRLVALAGG